jgi:PilZ domain-containing protein
MQLPLQIVQVGAEKVNRTEQTRDISSGGVCFLSSEQVEVGGRIEYLITLSGSNPPVRIRCLGKVLRSQKQDTGEPPFEVAVTMERYQFVSPVEAETFAVAS